MPSLLSLLLLLARVLVLFHVGWLCAAPGCHPVFFDSLCARYAQCRILCAIRVAWWLVRAWLVLPLARVSCCAVGASEMRLALLWVLLDE